MKNKYFTVAYTDASPHEESRRIGVHFRDVPKANEDGSTSFSMIWPGLLVAEGVNEPERFAETVAEILNENADRFFDSAKT